MSRHAICLERYRHGVWRDRILHDLILEDAERLGGHLTFLDIGCGRGFDTDEALQWSLANVATRYIGIEPDSTIMIQECYTETHRCILERAPIQAESIDIAFAIMVLEHLANPRDFWDKLYDVLKPGGVFWGLTIDGRHWFRAVSLWLDRTRLKNVYLRWLSRAVSAQQYENYPVYYRSNTPSQIGQLTTRFRACEVFSLSREGQLNAYLPQIVHPLFEWFDRRAIRRDYPGTLLVVRAEK
ncbi:MAG TPA: class I SAM-dependent methyltransferase [Candidatus Acidoferrum sp.]|nr:class I SAM-dependent methyltransferase [Candidatus Acidoferrum sp.]